MFTVEKIRILQQGEILSFESKKNDVRAINVDMAKGVIQIEYEKTAEWRYSIIPITQTQKIDYNILTDEFMTVITQSIQK